MDTGHVRSTRNKFEKTTITDHNVYRNPYVNPFVVQRVESVTNYQPTRNYLSGHNGQKYIDQSTLPLQPPPQDVQQRSSSSEFAVKNGTGGGIGGSTPHSNGLPREWYRKPNDPFRPHYDANRGQWVLSIRNLPGEYVYGIITRAARKQDRLQMEFTFSNGERRKFYLCHLCWSAGQNDIWIGYKNFVHQHIKRHHQHELCSPCRWCGQMIFNEQLSTHQRACQKRFHLDVEKQYPRRSLPDQ